MYEIVFPIVRIDMKETNKKTEIVAIFLVEV